MYDEIKKNIIHQGEVRSPATNYELTDIHGNYEKGKQFLSAIGGQIQQMYYILDTIFVKYADDLNEYHKRQQADPTDESLKKPQNPRELLIERHFLPFFMTYLRDLKSDHLSLLVTPKL